MTMWKYIARRILATIPVILLVSIAVFSMLHLIPGDPVQVILGGEDVPAEQMEKLREKLGLNYPLHIQYLRFLWKAFQGDLGRSIYNDRPVMAQIIEQFPSTLELTIAGMIVGVFLGVLAGIIAALRQNAWLDNVSMVTALMGVAMPSFWMGLLLIFLFSLKLGWVPATGQGGVLRLILPAFTLGFGAAAIIARLVRSSMLEVLRMEYITTARAKGLVERLVIIRHALKNALIPVVTVIGLQFGQLLSGTVIIETVFSRRGIGRLAVQAIIAKDFTLVQGTVLFTALIYVLANLLVDISYSYIDPRIRYE